MFGVPLSESKSTVFYFCCKSFVPLAPGCLLDLADLYLCISSLEFTALGNKG